MKIAICVVAGLVWGFGAVRASAVPLYTFSGGQPTGIASGSFNIGNYFTVGSANIAINQFGAYVPPAQQSAGLTTQAYATDLYSFNGSYTLLQSVLIPIGTAVDSQNFAYTTNLTSTKQLNQGISYVLTDVATNALGTAVAASSTYFAYNLAGGAPAGTFTGVTFNNNNYKASPASVTDDPDSVNTGFDEFMGGNLQVTVPEPGSLALVGVGALGLFARRRRTARWARGE